MSDNFRITGKESQMTPGLQVFVKEKKAECREKTIRVAAYCRVSTNLEIQVSSLKNQIDAFREVIKQHPGWKLAGVYADHGITGTCAKNRESFLRMISDAEKGKIDYIIAKSISRFARNTVDTLNYTRKLKEKGIGVYFEEQKIDTSNIASEMLLTIHAAFAQEESHSMSENVKKGVRSRFAMGIPKWSATYGIKRVAKDKWEPVPEEAEIVRRIFQMCIEGVSLPDISKVLESEGIPGPGKKQKWFAHSISTLLHNEKYIGDVAMQKDYAYDLMSHKRRKNDDATLPRYYKSNHHEAIVDHLSFDLAQMILEMKDRHKGSTQYPFYGFLRCPFCGELMVSVSLPSRMHHLAWTCAGENSDKILRKDRTDCSPFFVKDSYIHQGVIRAFARLTEEQIKDANPQFLEKYRHYKNKDPMQRVEYIFLYDLVESITFPFSEKLVDWNKIQVNWKCGFSTFGSIDYQKASEIPVTRDTAELDGLVYYANGIRTNGQTNAYYSVQALFDFCDGIRIYSTQKRDKVGSTSSLETRLPIVLAPTTDKEGFKGDITYEGSKDRRNNANLSEECCSIC